MPALSHEPKSGGKRITSAYCEDSDMRRCELWAQARPHRFSPGAPVPDHDPPRTGIRQLSGRLLT
jgi:hypothetical protein